MQEIQTTLGKIRTLVEAGQTLYSAADIAQCLGYSGSSKLIQVVRRLSMDVIECEVQNPMGLRTMKFLNWDTLRAVLHRVTKTAAETLADELGFEMNCIRVQRKEEATIVDIVMCFHPHLKMTRQYRVGPYRVDLYIHELNIVVECDEDDHRHYDTTRDEKRTRAINDLIAPTWVRYNPDNGIQSPIGTIIAHMVGRCSIEKVNETERENEELKKQLAETEGKLVKIRNLL